MNKERFFKKILLLLVIVLFLVVFLFVCNGYDNSNKKYFWDNEINISLSDDSILVNGDEIVSFDEYIAGKVYLSNDVIYYEDKDVYESGNPYGAGMDSDKHTVEEAGDVKVINIVKAGTYRISGKLSQGQIRVDLGEGSYKDKNAVVKIILDNVDINCSIAPAILFLNVYECDFLRDTNNATEKVDTADAGANIIIADNSENNLNGGYVAKIYKDKTGLKKKWKQEGTIESRMSINIDSEEDDSGCLNINAAMEGISSDMHVTINGGNINITAFNDGINASNDLLSVVTINGGNIRIIGGTMEDGGDGIDSNGWIVVNGGIAVSAAHPHTDSGVDNEEGCYINGGTFISFGGTLNWPEQESLGTTFNIQFIDGVPTDKAFIITDTEGKVLFCYDPSKDDIINKYVRNSKGVIISKPGFNIGEYYHLYIGGKVDGNENAGLYDVESIKDFSGAVQQMYCSGQVFEGGGFYPDPKATYEGDNYFLFKRNVSCFALVSDFVANK